MKSLKNHISVIIPLFILLFSFQFSIVLDRMIKNYEKTLTNDYALIAVTLSKLNEEKLKNEIGSIASITEIDKDVYLSKFKDKLSKVDLTLLKATLPLFYNIKLETFPDEDEIKRILNKLKENPKITKVETFKRTFNKYRQFLQISKSVSTLFTFFIVIIGFLLLVKQMEIWTLQHKKRMYIMGLFGAPFWMKSATLYKLVVIDSIICAILVSFLFYYIPNSESFINTINQIGISFPKTNYLMDSLYLIALSLAIAIFSVTIVILRQKKV